jgi:hypothetical protein
MQNIENICPYTQREIDVPAGKVAIVVDATGDTIAVLHETTTIPVMKTPVANMVKKAAKRSVATRDVETSDGITVTYKDYSATDSKLGITYSTLKGIAAFEDTRQGDYDYNDLIFKFYHRLYGIPAGETMYLNWTKVYDFWDLIYYWTYEYVSKEEWNGANQEHPDNYATSYENKTGNIEYVYAFYVKPIALGAAKTIDLGITINDQDNVLIKDVRSEMFNGDKGFINTEGTYKEYAPKTLIINDALHYGFIDGVSTNQFKIYIQADGGEKLYLSDFRFGKTPEAVLDSKNRPMGICMIGKEYMTDVTYKKHGHTVIYNPIFGWSFPKEKNKIDDIYPFEDVYTGKKGVEYLNQPYDNTESLRYILDDTNKSLFAFPVYDYSE